MRVFSTVAIGAAITLAAAPASAQTVANDAVRPSSELVREGIAARRAGEDARAVELFRRAFASDPRPMVRAQLALALQATGAWEEAEPTLLAALAAAEDPWIVSHRAVLDEAARTIASHLCSLEVLGTPVGAALFVNGARAATLPLAAPLRLRAGATSIELRAEGYHSQERRVELVAGQRFREQFVLVERPHSSANDGVAPLVRTVPTRSVEAPRAVVRGERAPYAAIALTGGGVLVGVSGAIVTGLGAAGVATLRARCTATDRADTEPLECPDDASIVALRDQSDAMLVAGQTLAVVGGAAAVGGAVYWVLASRRANHWSNAARASFTVAPAAGGVSIRGAF